MTLVWPVRSEIRLTSTFFVMVSGVFSLIAKVAVWQWVYFA